MKAIVFTSNSGYTEKYAKMLGEQLNLPVYSLTDAKSKLPEKSKIIYLGWLMAGSVKGCSKAVKMFDVRAVCAVGMAAYDEKYEREAAERHHLSVKVFYLQGGYDINKLHGIYKFMMNMIAKTVGKQLENKPDKTDEEVKMLDMLKNGGDKVNVENLQAVIEWAKSEK